MKARGVAPLAIAGIAMVVAFFGPWIDLAGIFQRSGFDLATDGDLDWKRHLLWLYPLGGAALAYAALRGAREARAIALLVGGGVVGLAAWDAGSGLIEHLRYGAWVTIAGAVIAISSGVWKGDRGWTLAGGALIVIGFFMPWLWTSSGDEYPVSMSGWELAHLPLLKVLYLVPLFGALAAVASFAKGARSRLLAIAAGAGVLAALAYIYLSVESMAVGWGAWATLGAGAAALVGALLLTPRARPAK